MIKTDVKIMGKILWTLCIISFQASTTELIRPISAYRVGYRNIAYIMFGTRQSRAVGLGLAPEN